MSGNQDFVIGSGFWYNGVLQEYKGPGGDVTILEDVTEIGSSAFEGCTGLTSVTIPEGVKEIGESAFKGCTGLTSVTIPEGVTTIGESAFNGCAGLTSVTLPKSIKEIESGAFAACSKLASVTMWASSLTEDVRWMFGKSGKTIPIVLLREREEPLRAVVVFRREYYMQSWNCEKDILTPLDPEDIALYDTLIATGECEGFKVSNDGRIRAMLWRLLDSERLVARDIRKVFADFLSNQTNKVLKYAQEDGEPAYILALRNVGAISEDELPKLRKKLAKDPAFAQVLKELDAPAPVAEEPEEEADSRVEKSVLDQLRKLNAKSVLMKHSLTALPDIPLAGSDEIAPKEYLQLILMAYISRPGELSRLADKTAEKLDGKALREALLSVYEGQSDKTKIAMLGVVCRYADGATVTKLYREYTANKRTEDAARQALLLSDTREALLIMDKTRWRWGVVLLEVYAEMRGTDADTIRDTVLVDFGLDKDGKKVYDLGGNTVTVSLTPELSLCIFDNNAGKTVRSIPKKGADEARHEAAKADFAELKKNVKKVAKGRCALLFQYFLIGKTWTADEWQTSYKGDHFLLQQVASLLVWSQDGQTFTLRDGAAIDSGEQSYSISSKPIQVAHPMEMRPEDVAAWQRYFNNHGIKQPFAQVWEPVIRPDTVKEDRYNGIQIPAYRFKGQEKHGISFDFQYGVSELYIGFSGCGLEYDPWGGAVSRHMLDLNGLVTLGKFTFKTYSRQVNHIVSLLDKWTIYGRILKDDVSVVTMLDSATLAQVMQYLNLAIDNGKANVTAELLNYKNERFPDFDPLAEFTLDDL